MAYLIDGYNLLHAMGILQGRTGPTGLEKARRRLLGLLHGTYGDRSSEVTVVFDAVNAPPDATEVQNFQGIHVRFAVRQDEADDLIEDLIQHDSAPRRLTVVSDDHRIQKAARHRHCQVVSCAEYLDGLNRSRRQHQRRPSAAPAKPEGVSRQETQHWLEEFADLADDAGLKELFDPYDFDEKQE
jgi:predicted RNA-binding protein with PIN domain